MTRKHTAEHHKGGRKSEDAKMSMEAFALMREQLKREREIKSDLLEALQAIVKSLVDQDDEGMIEHAQQMINSRAAIAKATGELE